GLARRPPPVGGRYCLWVTKPRSSSQKMLSFPTSASHNAETPSKNDIFSCTITFTPEMFLGTAQVRVLHGELKKCRKLASAPSMGKTAAPMPKHMPGVPFTWGSEPVWLGLIIVPPAVHADQSKNRTPPPSPVSIVPVDPGVEPEPPLPPW